VTQQVFTNLDPNPSCETNVSGYAAVSGVAAPTRVTTTPYVGTARLAAVGTGVSVFGRVSTDIAGFTTGDVVTVQARVRSDGQTPTNGHLQIRNADGSVILASAAPAWAPDGAGWMLVAATATIPAGVTQIRVFRGVQTSAPFTGTLGLDAAMTELGAVASDYFDGNTPDTSGWTYEWTGTPNNSTSVKHITSLPAPSWANGLPVTTGGPDGGQVTEPGQLQYGDMLMGAGTAASWLELVGWRDRPDVDLSDSQRPQAHGSYPGDVFAGSKVVTYTFLLRGTPDAKAAAVDTLERYLPLDSVERFLTVDDGTGPWFAMARVTGLHIPQDKHYRHSPLQCSVQFTCADPRRYALALKSGTVTLPVASGGLDYPLVYPLVYGTSASGAVTVSNSGSTETPLRGQLVGPLTNPVLTTTDWSLLFDITLAAGETLDLDASAGTALLNGTADRLYTIGNLSDPLEACFFKPGDTNLSLSAFAGSGQLNLTYRDARL